MESSVIIPLTGTWRGERTLYNQGRVTLRLEIIEIDANENSI